MKATQNACFAILHASLSFMFVQYRPICYSDSIPNAGITLHRRGLVLCPARSPTCGSRVNDERLRCLN